MAVNKCLLKKFLSFLLSTEKGWHITFINHNSLSKNNKAKASVFSHKDRASLKIADFVLILGGPSKNVVHQFCNIGGAVEKQI